MTYEEALAEGKLNGRRLQRLYEQSRYKFRRPEPSAAQGVAMASRRLRRSTQGDRFIPVYGFTGPTVSRDEFDEWRKGTWVGGEHVYPDDLGNKE